MLLPCALLANTTVLKDNTAMDARLVGLALQDVNSAGFDIPAPKPEVPVGDSLALLPALTASLDAATHAADDMMQDGPRPKMKKWFFAILLVGGLIRYLTSPAYGKFVSDVLDPLNW
jgi:hypothetical protein